MLRVNNISVARDPIMSVIRRDYNNNYYHDIYLRVQPRRHVSTFFGNLLYRSLGAEGLRYMVRRLADYQH